MASERSVTDTTIVGKRCVATPKGTLCPKMEIKELRQETYIVDGYYW